MEWKLVDKIHTLVADVILLNARKHTHYPRASPICTILLSLSAIQTLFPLPLPLSRHLCQPKDFRLVLPCAFSALTSLSTNIVPLLFRILFTV